MVVIVLPMITIEAKLMYQVGHGTHGRYNLMPIIPYFNRKIVSRAIKNPRLINRAFIQKFSSGGGSGGSTYSATILADSPYAFWRATESSGTTLADSSGNSRTLTLPGSGYTLGLAGAVSDGTGKSFSLDGSTGISIGATIADAVLGSANWSVEFWYNSLNRNQTIFGGRSATGGSAESVIWDNVNYLGTPAGGGSLTLYTQTWHHVVLTSSGAVYIDGTALANSGGWSTGSTSEMYIGAKYNNTDISTGRFAEIALYTTSLSSARVLAHYNAGVARTLPAGLTFAWGFETDTPDTFPAGSCDLPLFAFGSTRSTAQHYTGSYSLEMIGNTYQSVMFDNPTNQHVWASPTKGTWKLKFRYTGATYGMLGQITGKDREYRDDTNDSISIYFDSYFVAVHYRYANGTSEVVLTNTLTVAENTWHTMELKWDITSGTTMSLNIDGTTVTTSTVPGAVACQTWHHLLIGNDTNSTPVGLWIDDVEVYGSWI